MPDIVEMVWDQEALNAAKGINIRGTGPKGFLLILLKWELQRILMEEEAMEDFH